MRPLHIEEVIIDEPEAVRLFLEEIDLPIKGVLAVRDAAHVHLVDTSPLMAINSPGTLAYHYGILELRVQFLGKKWELARAGGFEAIFNPAKARKVGYQNVDLACSRVQNPAPRTEKGAGLEREFEANLFEYYGVAAPKMAYSPDEAGQVYYIMVDEQGAVEVSRPVIENKTFTGFIVRAFVSDGSDLKREIPRPRDLDAPADNFEVPVIRRQA